MAVAVHSTSRPDCLPPCISAAGLRLQIGDPLPEPGTSGAWSAEALARLFHHAERGALRAHARAERLAGGLAEGSVDLRCVPVPWLPPAAPLPVLKQRLAYAGSPGVAEGESHARLRLGAYALAAAMAGPGDRVLLEAPTPSACRPDVTLVQWDGTRLLGLECGTVSSDTLADHLEVGRFEAVIVLPFAMLDAGDDPRHGWVLTRRGLALPPLPSAAAMAAVYASLIGPGHS